MQQESVDAHGREVARMLQRGVRRVRIRRALVATVLALAAALPPCALLTFQTAGDLAPRALGLDLQWTLVPLLLTALVVVPALASACLRVDAASVARRIDRAHGLHDILQAALDVARLPAGQRTTFGGALLRQADALAPRLSLQRALPLHVPRAARAAAACALLASLAMAAWPRGGPVASRAAPRQQAPARAAQQNARAPAPIADDLSAEQRGAGARQREIVRALVAGDISPAQAIGRLLALERELRHAAAEELLPGELLERVEQLLEGKPGKSPRTLADAAEVLRAPDSTPERREEQRRLIEEKRRELEKLRAEHAESAAARRELDKLSRQLGDAAKALAAGRPEQAASQLEQAVRQAREQAQARRQREQQKGAAEAAAQLRERLQRQRAGRGPGADARQGQLRREQEQRFAQRAEGGEQLVQGVGGGSGDPAAPSPEPSLLGREPRPRVSLEDHAAPSAQGDGPSRSEVVMSAADRGFAGESYRAVYADYRDHAEAVLERDQVPSGYRYHVRRYFQLIRPRTRGTP